ncbi:platelet glycoprotein Ib alpha chain-like [Girardinichthys multiradiatus]|uniref:platelet glycoprotein Ib alpha chain-like n=1 Tax=Girardinichthys multiradiatus TaxID=208333 RepID=UPI001FAC29CB|nr:platelet glycoprotein Ib alpha chain-like [Girardinichthys multiradiatus]
MKTMMMEAKLWIPLCALLLVSLRSVADATNNTRVPEIVPNKNESLTTQLPLMSPAAATTTTEGPETGTNISDVTYTSSNTTPHMNQPSSNPNNTLHSSPAAPMPSNPSTQNETSSPSSVPTPEPTATAITNSTSNTSSSQETATFQPSTNTSESSFGSTKAHPRTTISLLNSTSTHAESPSQLSVGDDDAHNSPALDPLLAGLVSAFVITAVIIALLLFLKLRKRDSGPQFRRLQDLPMDDMMEDTPLSMYNY